MILQSIRAGVFIALGCILYLSVPNSIIGAFLFSLGLLSVRLTQSYLYTRQVHQTIESNRQWKEMFWIWIANILGASLVYLIFAISSLFGNIELYTAANSIEIEKLNIPYIEMFIRSIGCGIFMTIATQKDTPLWITSGCVIALF